MTRHFPHVAAASPPPNPNEGAGATCNPLTYTMDCRSCDGSGVSYRIVRFAGEPMYGELDGIRCPDCHGAGTFLFCEGCDAELSEGESCSDCSLVEVERISPTRIGA